MRPFTPPAIRRPPRAQFRHYCFECPLWTRDAAYEAECWALYQWAQVEPRGYCVARQGLTSCHRQACQYGYDAIEEAGR